MVENRFYFKEREGYAGIGYSLEHIYFTNLVHKKKERGKDYVKQL